MGTKPSCIGTVHFTLSVTFALIAMLALYACQQNPKQVPPKKQTKAIAKKSIFIQSEPSIPPDSISLFNLGLIEAGKGDSVGFVDVSDIDALPGSYNSPPDSVEQLVIPSLDNKKPEQTKYFILSSKYRKRLLTDTRIKETDTLFIYDYAKDTLLRFPIRSLPAVANLSVYEDATLAQHSARDYEFGFKINRTDLAGLSNAYFANTLVYIGADNPFIRGQMHPIIWKKTDEKKIPVIKLDAVDAEALKGFKLSGSYAFVSDSLHYYLQQFAKSNEQPAVRLIISNDKDEVIYNELDYETESSSPAPLSFAESSKNQLSQWTGRLLKNRPPLILGFEDIEFGCPILPFIDKSRRYVDLKCDNRH